MIKIIFPHRILFMKNLSQEFVFKILVVDDEEDMTEILKSTLDQSGIFHHITNDSVEALKLIEANNYLAVLCDIKMPVLSGIDLLKEVRKQRKDVPFIFLTAQADKDLVKEAFKLGAHDFIEKPFKQKQMIDVISKTMEIGRRQARLKESTCAQEIKKDIEFIEKMKLLKI